MVKLRLKRIGRKKIPFYRIVAMDVNAPRDGQALGELGTYDPLKSRIDLDEEAMVHWLKVGAQMTETVRDLLRSQGVLARMQGLEGKVRDDALLRDKPKRRKKLADAAPAAEEAEAPAPEAPAPVTESPAEAVAVADEAPAEEVAAADGSAAAPEGDSGPEPEADDAADKG